jgi:hypothetical protein
MLAPSVKTWPCHSKRKARIAAGSGGHALRVEQVAALEQHARTRRRPGGERVAARMRAEQDLGELPQQRVARGVPQVSFTDLELVEVDVEHRVARPGRVRLEAGARAWPRTAGGFSSSVRVSCVACHDRVCSAACAPRCRPAAHHDVGELPERAALERR